MPNKLQPGAILHLLPDTIKNKKGGHSSVTLTCDLLCLSTWFQLAVAQYAAAGQPITNYLTRPLQVGTKTYTEKGMTCSNAWARLTKYLKELGMYSLSQKFRSEQLDLHVSTVVSSKALN
ncbi:TPA: hypothetical protein ACH3X1_001149 [Trebouxia sp. C0004]